MEVTDNNESSFKVAEETVASKTNPNLHEKAKASTKVKSPAMELPKPPQEHTGGKTKTYPALVIGKSSHKFHEKAKEFNESVPRPYHIQTHIVNVTNQNSNHPVTGLPIRLHVHPELPLPVSDSPKQADVLSKQQANDLQSSKTSTIHNHGKFEWGAFSMCSVTCGSGVRKRYRRCSVEECTAPGMETQVIPCISTTCSGMYYYAASELM